MNLNNIIKLNNEELGILACKLTLDEFKKISVGSKYYSRQNLKIVFNTVFPKATKTNINFILSQGYIYLVPESGQGFETDLAIIKKVLKLLS